MPNQRELAKQLGLSQGTISLALRNSPLVAQTTREQVQAAASAIGYHPNPMVSALMEHIRTGQPIKDKGCLAILVDFPDKESWLSFHLAYRQQYEAMSEQAAKRGYRTECFFLRAPGMTPAKVDRILYQRGIRGVILAGPRQDNSYALEFKWQHYACIKSGYTWPDIPIDCVTADNRQHVELAFQSLRIAGYRKVGYCLHKNMIGRADANWEAGHYIIQRNLPNKSRVPMHVTIPTEAGKSAFYQWLDTWRPDAIIGGQLERIWLLERKTRKQSPLFCTRFFRPDDKEIPAIEENDKAIGETLCDLVIAMLLQNKCGLPEQPRKVLIPGSWHAGSLKPA